MLLLLMVMMMRWRKWWSFIIIIIMIISWGCYFWWSIKCRIDHTAKWRQQNCHDGTISDRVWFELVSNLWFWSVGDWYNFHFPPFLLLPLKLLDNWQFAKWQKLQVFCGIFCHHLLDILTNCKLWLDVLAILVTTDRSFYGPGPIIVCPCQSLPRGTYVFINYSG